MNISSIDRIQGLIDLYFKAGKSLPAVKSMMEYLILQERMTEEEAGQVLEAISLSTENPLNIKSIIDQMNALIAEKEDLQDQVAAFTELTLTTK